MCRLRRFCTARSGVTHTRGTSCGGIEARIHTNLERTSFLCPPPVLDVVLIGGTSLLFFALAISTTDSDDIFSTEEEMRQSNEAIVITLVGVVGFVTVMVLSISAMAYAFKETSEFFSSNTPRGEVSQSEESTTAPATSEPAQADK